MTRSESDRNEEISESDRKYSLSVIIVMTIIMLLMAIFTINDFLKNNQSDNFVKFGGLFIIAIMIASFFCIFSLEFQEFSDIFIKNDTNKKNNLDR